MSHWKSCLGVSLITLFARAGEEVVTLEGKTYIVKTSTQGVVHVATPDFTIENIYAKFDSPSGWRQPGLVWKVVVYCNWRFSGTLTFEPPIGRTLRVVGHDTKFEGFRQFLTFEVLDSSVDIVKFLSVPGDKWVPFRIRMTQSIGSGAIDYLDWVRITDEERKKGLAFIAQYQLRQKELTTIQSLTMADGETLNLTLMDNKPVRHCSNRLQIDALFPTLLKNPKADGNDLPIWTLKGQKQDDTEAFIEAKAPWFRKGSLFKVRITQSGEFGFRFAPKDEAPELWDWLKTNKEQWLPIAFTLTTGSPPITQEIVEWCHVDEKGIESFRKAISNQDRLP